LKKVTLFFEKNIKKTKRPGKIPRAFYFLSRENYIFLVESFVAAESFLAESTVAEESFLAESTVVAESFLAESAAEPEPEPLQAATDKVIAKAKKPNLNAFFIVKFFKVIINLVLIPANIKR
jgi:hypothetical protein